MSISSLFSNFFSTLKPATPRVLSLRLPKFKQFEHSPDGEARRPPAMIMLLGPKKASPL